MIIISPFNNLSDRLQLDNIRQQLEQKLEDLRAEIGVEFKIGRMKYNSDGERFSVRLEATLVGAASKEEKAWKFYAPLHGFKASDLGRKFEGNSQNLFQITGWRTRATRRQVETIRVIDGATYSFTPLYVVTKLAAQNTK